MIIHKYKIIFLHIPKTAGFSIEKFFDNNKRNHLIFDSEIVWGLKDGKYTQHFEYKKIKEYYQGKENIDNYFKFTFVRNTWDRLLSAYSYLNPNPKKEDFCEYLRKKCKALVSGELGECDHYNSQIRYIYNDGEEFLDFIGKFENIQEDFKKLCEKISVDYKKLPLLNFSSRKKEYKEYYNEETLNLVKEVYKKEIEYFDYKY